MNHWSGGRELHSERLQNGPSLARPGRPHDTGRGPLKLPWVAAFALAFVVSDNTWAKDRQISGSASGTFISVNLDLDVDNPADQSIASTSAGIEEPGGPFSFFRVAEGELVAGTGCSIAPTASAGCTIDGATDGCLASDFHGGGSLRYKSTGDILAFQLTGGTSCINLNSASGFAPPYKVEETDRISFTGGSGKFANAAGNATVTAVGFIQGADGQHSFGWLRQTYTGTLTTP
jgi:hypothetical protein